MDAALVAYAVQAGVSIGGAPAAACGAHSRAVSGRMSRPRALALLTAGSACSFTFVDPVTVRITLRPPAGRRPSPRPLQSPPPRQGQPEAGELPEVVVTAAKRPIPIGQAPYAVTVVSGTDLSSKSGGGGLGDITGQVAGMILTNLGAGRDKIFLRGLSDGAFTGRTQSTVGLFLDDVPITYDAPDPDLLLADVSQVEVLRGPQGTLYGSGSMGGVVRIATRKPDLLHFGATLSAGGAATDHGNGSRLSLAVLNAPVATGLAAVRAVAYEQVTGGYIDDIGLGLSNVNRTRRSGGRLSVLVEPNQDLSVTAGLTHQSTDAADTQYAQATLGSLQRRRALQEPHDNDFDEAFVTVKRSGDWGEAKVTAAYVNHNLLSRYDATGAFRQFNPAPSSAIAFNERQQVDLSEVEANLSSPGQGRLTWLTGLYFSDSQEKDGSMADAVSIARTFYRADRIDRRTETALYGEASYALSPRLKATVGFRWFGSKLSAHTSAVEDAVSSRYDGHLTNVDISPKVLVSYSSSGWVGYVQASQGYRSGGINGEPRTGVVATLPRNFQSDQLWNYEAGAAGSLLSGRLRVRGALFHAEWSNLQSDQYLASGLPITLNVGHGANTGIELEADYNPFDRLRLHGALQWDDPQLTRVRTVFPARVDRGLPAVPPFSAGLSATYSWRLGARMAAQLSADASYVGRSHLTFDAGAATGEGGYAVTNLSGALSSGPWRLDLYLNNVTDETANTFAHGNPFSRPSLGQITPLRPRTTGVQLSRSF